mmetsp:Transcript_8508/g.16289  ORF Transcript_8508/g.16289 Transcript_8508/m.16289 type:complete len:253 (-) Transcript_8508:190-948(-)|eukprot:scaffold1771_cov172-Amphora_coffeaeformis.AAC.20
MAFFKLFKKKKKEETHKKLQGGAPPSPPSPPPAPPTPNIHVSNNGIKQRPAQVIDDSIRQQSLFTQGGIDTGRNVTKVTTTEHIPAVAASPVTTPPPISNSTLREFEANRAAIDLTRSLVKRFIADIWNRGEVDLIPEVCSSSLRFNGNTGFDRVGHEGLARMVNTIREALDDYHCEIHSMVVENNKAFCRLRFTGKHTGNLLGYPPTKKVVAWMGATEFTCQNGKILKVWELGDIKTLEEQLTTEIEMDEV